MAHKANVIQLEVEITFVVTAWHEINIAADKAYRDMK